MGSLKRGVVVVKPYFSETRPLGDYMFKPLMGNTMVKKDFSGSTT